MTSKERILLTIDHSRTDRVPATYKGTPEVDKKIMDYFGLGDIEEIKNVFPVDNVHWPWRNLYPKGLNSAKTNGGVTYDIWGVGRSRVDYGSGSYDEVTVRPLASATTVTEVQNYNWPKVADLDFSTLIDWRGNIVDPKVDKYKQQALGGCMWTIFERAYDMRGLEQFLTDLAINEDIAWAIIKKVQEFCWDYNLGMIRAVGKELTVAGTGDDFGSQTSLLMSIDMWKKYFMPGMKEAYAFFHRHGMKVCLHCDGAVHPLIPYFIDIGVDVLDPVQPQANGMILEEIWREFGKDLCLHGTIDVQSLLPFGKPEEVRAEVRSQLERYARNGGFFMSPSHCMQSDTPIENVIALYNALEEFGQLS